MPHNDLTIDFNDASFDTSMTRCPTGTSYNVDVVLPISDNVTLDLGSF